MDIAVSQSGEFTHAANAIQSNRYRCPVCRVRVIYAAGPKQSPHFRHSPRTSIEERRIQDCPNYVADQGGTGGSFGAGRIAQPAPPPRPRLAVGWVRSGSDAQCWALLTTVPVPPDEVRSVRLDEYVNGGIDIGRELVLRSRQFYVRAANRQYQAIGFDQTHRPVWYPNPTDPLAAIELNFFHAGANGGLQLAPDEPLIKGRSYVVVCGPPTWRPPPDGLFREIPRVDFCDPRRAWRAFMVYLPLSMRPDVNSWCSAVARRPLVERPPELDLVAPPAKAMQPDGAYRVAAGQDVILALRGGDWIEPVVELNEEVTGRSQEWSLEIEADDFIRVGALAPGSYAIHVRDWELVSIRLCVVDEPTPKVQGVELRTCSRDGAAEFRTSLFSELADERWASLLSGRELWRGIQIPDGWPVSLAWTTRGLGDQTRSALSAPEVIAGALSACLLEDPDSARLDAGAFGTITYQKVPAILAKRPRSKNLQSALRDRLRWLALARSAAPKGGGIPLSITVPDRLAGSLEGDDRQLVTEFLAVASWPAPLIPQARSVGHSLTLQLCDD
jgi:hypothetical protein